MFGQTFSLSDIPRVAVLAFLEILLSADNAIVLGLLVKGLAPDLKKKALFIGVLSAFFFRLMAIVLVIYLFHYSWIQTLGALYLIYLACFHFIKKRKREPLLPPPLRSFWMTIFMVELFDLAFAVDSIVAAMAFIGASSSAAAIIHPKLWIVYIGGMAGVLGIRYASHLFSTLIDRFPRLEPSAYLMVGWIGIKLCLTSLSLHFPYFESIFWLGMVLLFLFGLIKIKGRHV